MRLSEKCLNYLITENENVKQLNNELLIKLNSSIKELDTQIAELSNRGVSGQELEKLIKLRDTHQKIIEKLNSNAEFTFHEMANIKRLMDTYFDRLKTYTEPKINDLDTFNFPILIAIPILLAILVAILKIIDNRKNKKIVN